MSENISTKTLMIFKDPNQIKRAATKIAWHPDQSEMRVGVTYAMLRFQQMPKDMPRESYIWNLQNPDHIKIDVDGIEYLILRSLDGMLENTKSILVEVDKKFHSNNEIIKEILTRNKFKLKKNLFDNRNQFNQIWYKDNNE